MSPSLGHHGSGAEVDGRQRIFERDGLLSRIPCRKSGNQASFILQPLRHVLPAREGEHHSRLSLRHGRAIDNDILSGCFWQPNSAQQPTPFAAATSQMQMTNGSCSCAPYLWPCLPIVDVKQCRYLISQYAAVRVTFSSHRWITTQGSANHCTR
jgi:hypothetical protein